MNAQTEQLIYWKQRHDKLTEQHTKAVEALRGLMSWLDDYDKNKSALSRAMMRIKAEKKARAVLAAIEQEPTDA